MTAHSETAPATAGPPPDSTLTDFVAAMGRVATAVTVVGAAARSEWMAQTVSAMCSVSAEPPMVLVCIHGRSPINDAIEASGAFAVSALATRHDHVADTFAGRPWPGKDRWDFTCGDWDAAPSGSPRVVDALASFDCTLHDVVTAGTHRVYIGRVQAVTAHDGVPLVYADHTYGRPVPVEPSEFPEYPDAHPRHRRESRRS